MQQFLDFYFLCFIYDMDQFTKYGFSPYGFGYLLYFVAKWHFLTLPIWMPIRHMFFSSVSFITKNKQ